MLLILTIVLISGVTAYESGGIEKIVTLLEPAFDSDTELVSQYEESLKEPLNESKSITSVVDDIIAHYNTTTDNNSLNQSLISKSDAIEFSKSRILNNSTDYDDLEVKIDDTLYAQNGSVRYLVKYYDYGELIGYDDMDAVTGEQIDSKFVKEVSGINSTGVDTEISEGHALAIAHKELDNYNIDYTGYIISNITLSNSNIPYYIIDFYNGNTIVGHTIINAITGSIIETSSTGSGENVDINSIVNETEPVLEDMNTTNDTDENDTYVIENSSGAVVTTSNNETVVA